MKKIIMIFILLFPACNGFLHNKKVIMPELLIARKFVQNRDKVRAALFYGKVLEKNPNSIESVKFLYKFYLENKYYKRAFAMLLKGAELDKSGYFWHIEMAEMLIQNREIEEGCNEISVAVNLIQKQNVDVVTKIEKLKEVCH